MTKHKGFCILNCIFVIQYKNATRDGSRPDVVRAVGLEPTTYGLEDIKRGDDESRQVTFISSQCGLSLALIG